MNPPQISIEQLGAALLDRIAPALQTLGNGIVSGVTATRRDLEHRMYEQATVASARYALNHMVKAMPCRQTKYNSGGRLELLELALTLAKVDGFFEEFGVFKGESLRFIADRIDRIAYGFDSFEGLPSDWFLGMSKGTYSLDGELPDIGAVQRNVRLVKGWFETSIPLFTSEVREPAAFLHIDCDLYESTKIVLDCLSDRIVPGTVIVFDEYLNYPGWEQHEFKAFQEFCGARSVKYSYVAFAPIMFSVAIRIDDLKAP